MIKSFIFDGKKIPLRPSPRLGSNGEVLFSADSMTLLVGKNGSGKTRALISLASMFSKDKGNKNTGYIEWGAQQEALETCAIYYTPVPYQIDIPKSTDRFRSIQTGELPNKQSLSARHREIISELEKEFGLDARRTLSLPAVSPQSLSEIMSRALSTHYSAAGDWTEPFHSRYKLYVQRLMDTRKSEAGKYYDSPEYQLIADEREKILREFTIALHDKIGYEFPLKIRAFQLARQGRAPSASAEKQLLESLGFATGVAPNKPATVPRQKFESALQKLRLIAQIVSDPSLAKNSYQVDDNQIEQLEALELGRLGKISLTGLSSGAAALIHQFSSINITCETLLSENANRRLLLLIDEGDAFLHFGWQQQYIEYLDKTVSRLKQKFDSVQVVIASHSPFLMSDFPRECIFLLDSSDWIEDLMEGGGNHIPSASFGAPLDSVVRHVGQAGTMGTFATRIIRQLVKDIEAGMRVAPQRVGMIDDPIIRRQMKKLVDERKLWSID
ncbi:ATP-binding protein [Pseudomonas sp. WS 5013]|uniref:AAA family ATPase n=1 Tax=Pseudomonas sp. WS 5013 TaxID=2717475 RepID=UPI0014735F40|nr:AAA family ATPase [Pseudomonas sp. WS 5013]NMY39855.1 ATP-binding protein [Pseudomonas sp. WS 5013]